MSEVLVLETRKLAEEKATLVPEPVGYKILCMVPKMDETYESGLAKSAGTLSAEQQATIVLFVVKLGPEAYADKTKFPFGPWCRKGDFIITRAYAGTRVDLFGTEWRLINDDSVDAVVDDPRGVRRGGSNI